MTIFRISFAGEIKKADHRTAGGKALVEFSLCKKNRTKQGEQESFTWIKVTLWEPADWMAAKLVKGAFVAGSGDMSTRSYEKDGEKKTSIEVRCTGFDVELPRDGQSADAPAPPPRSVPRTPAGGGGVDDEPLFARSEQEMMA